MTVHNDQGVPVEMRVEPTNKVDATVGATVTSAGALIFYRYTIRGLSERDHHHRPYAAPPPERRGTAQRHLARFLDVLTRERGGRVTETAYGVLHLLGLALQGSLAR